MLRLRRPIFLVFAITAALLPAADASAATTAQRFADAVERGKSAIRAKEPEFRAAWEALDFARCERVLERHKPPPAGELEHFVVYLVIAATGPMIQTGKPVLDQIVADLEAIPTRDPILRSGRAAWRDTVRALDAFPAVERPCEQLERWARSGWRKSSRPALDFEALKGEIEDDRSAENDRKLARAARRLRQLGVSAGDASRFTGDSLFDDIPDEITDVATDVDEPATPLRQGGR